MLASSRFRLTRINPMEVLTQSAWFRPHNRSEELKNLYLVGAGTHPGAGLPGVLSSARVLDTVVPHADTFNNPKSTRFNVANVANVEPERRAGSTSA